MMRRRPLSESSWKHGNRGWHRVRCRQARRLSEEAGLGLDMRMWFIGFHRAGAGGHAVFDPGELIELLPRVNRTSGEVSAYTDRAMRKTITALTEAKALAPTSNTRCLILPLDLADPRVTSRVHCPEHRHRDGWHSNFGWMPINQRTEFVEAVPDTEISATKSADATSATAAFELKAA